jgi:hypothetical protein
MAASRVSVGDGHQMSASPAALAGPAVRPMRPRECAMSQRAQRLIGTGWACARACARWAWLTSCRVCAVPRHTLARWASADRPQASHPPGRPGSPGSPGRHRSPQLVKTGAHPLAANFSLPSVINLTKLVAEQHQPAPRYFPFSYRRLFSFLCIASLLLASRARSHPTAQDDKSLTVWP